MIGFDDKDSTGRPVKILKGLAILVFILMAGSAGYMLLEKWDFFDSFYMTVITITTVGFREVRDVSQTGKIFTIILIFSGMGIIVYIGRLANLYGGWDSCFFLQ